MGEGEGRLVGVCWFAMESEGEFKYCPSFAVTQKGAISDRDVARPLNVARPLTHLAFQHVAPLGERNIYIERRDLGDTNYKCTRCLLSVCTADSHLFLAQIITRACEYSHYTSLGG